MALQVHVVDHRGRLRRRRGCPVRLLRGAMGPNSLAMATSDIAFLLVIMGSATIFFGPLVASIVYVGVEYLASVYLPERWLLIFGALFVLHDHGDPTRAWAWGSSKLGGGSSVALLEVRNMSVHFGGLAAVSDVSFDVGLGERLALIGPNGAGKTTLFNLLTGQLKPSGGTVPSRARTSPVPPSSSAPTWAWLDRSRSSACSPIRAWRSTH